LFEFQLQQFFIHIGRIFGPKSAHIGRNEGNKKGEEGWEISRTPGGGGGIWGTGGGPGRL